MRPTRQFLETPSIPMPVERRLETRIGAEFDVTFESDHNFYTGFTENLSEGGVFIAGYAVSSQLRAVGERIQIRFTLPGVEKPIIAVAELRWHRQYNPVSDTPPGVGLRFIELSDEDRRFIERFVNARQPLFYDD